MRRFYLVSSVLAALLTGIPGVSRAEADAPPPAALSALTTPAVEILQSAPACPDALCAPAPASRVWFGAEYLLWWSTRQPLPPLLTTGPVEFNGPGNRPNTLGVPGTVTLLDGPVNLGAYSGLRVAAGTWLGDAQRFGVEAGYLYLGENTAHRTFSAPGLPGTLPLSIPYFDPTIPGETTTGVALPRGGGFGGSADVILREHLHAWEANAVVRSGPGSAWEGIAGYRGLSLGSTLDFNTISTNAPPQPADVFYTTDRFRTTNDFHGGQLGVRGTWGRGSFFVRGAAKVALGNMHQTATLSGALTTNDYTNLGPVQTFPGGYLALPTNIGSYSRDRFAVVPEGNVTVGWRPADRLGLTVGYNLLYVSNVIRPGDQVDRVINPTQSPSFTGDPAQGLAGVARPAFPGTEHGVWFHGVSFGAQWQF